VPGRRFSRRYVERVNITNTMIVNRQHIVQAYNDRISNAMFRHRVAGAVTAVTRDTFTSGQRVGDRRVRLDEREIARTRGSALAPQIQPGRESRLGVADAVRRNVRVPPQAVVDRQVIVKREPPPSAARFARNRGLADAVREQAGRSPPPHDRDDRRDAADRRPGSTAYTNPRADAVGDAVQAAERDRLRAERNARVQRTRDDRPPQEWRRTDRRPIAERPSADEVVRRAGQSQPERRNLPDHQEQRQQVMRRELEQRQQPGRERAAQQRDQAREQPAAQRERHVERPQVERQSRPEPRQQSDNTQPGQQQNRGRGRPQKDDP